MISCIACKYIDNEFREANLVVGGVLQDNSCSFQTYVTSPRVASHRDSVYLLNATMSTC